jgi:DNA replication protein DnaC
MEILHHAKHAERLESKMNHTKNQYSEVEKYILSNNNSPFLIAGPSGSGKSSLMAFIAKKVIKSHSKGLLKRI